jgi:hypothetical protein
MQSFVFRVLVCVAAILGACCFADQKPLSARSPRLLIQNAGDATVVQRADVVAKQISTQEWLGPLSAIALSPFFGLACLSGAATYGPEWLQQRSGLIGGAGPLNSPLLFWSMLTLTCVTSLPRFTKVSKPFSLAAEKLEAYSAVIILIAMKFLSGTSIAANSELAHQDVAMVALASVPSLSWDILMSVAAAINILVVNTIKLAIEVIVWLVPFPTVDAWLELFNKSLCASLLALYAFSPMLATLLNLILFGICFLVYFRVRRHMQYLYDLLLLPMLERFIAGGKVRSRRSVAFLSHAWSGFPPKTLFHLRVDDEDPTTAHLYCKRWFRNYAYAARIPSGTCTEKMICDEVVLHVDQDTLKLHVRKGALGLGIPAATGVMQGWANGQ